MIKAENVSFIDEGRTILRDINMTVAPGEIIVLIGDKNSGKSELLQCLGLLQPISSGEIQIDGVVAVKRSQRRVARRKIGLVLSGDILFQHMMLVENLMFAARRIFFKGKQESFDNAMKYLKLVGLKSVAYSFPDELHEGERARAAIARAMVNEPELLLVDSLTDNMNPDVTGEVYNTMRYIAEMGQTIVAVTHNLDFAKSIATRVIFMKDGEIVEEGTPEKIFNFPDKYETGRYIKSLKTFDFHVDSPNADIYRFSTDLTNFCHEHVIPMKYQQIGESIFNTLCAENIMYNLPRSNYNLHYCFEYSESDASCAVRLKYKCDQYNPFLGGAVVTDDEDLTAILREAIYTYDQGENQIEILF